MGATIYHVKVTVSLRDSSQSGVDHGDTLEMIAGDVANAVSLCYERNRDAFACVPEVWA